MSRCSASLMWGTCALYLASSQWGCYSMDKPLPNNHEEKIHICWCWWIRCLSPVCFHVSLVSMLMSVGMILAKANHCGLHVTGWAPLWGMTCSESPDLLREVCTRCWAQERSTGETTGMPASQCSLEVHCLGLLVLGHVENMSFS